MLLANLRSEDATQLAAQSAFDLMTSMYPICRSITGNGVRQTLDCVEKLIPLMRSEVRTGTAAFDWEVPKEWNIRDAFIADTSGRRLVDFRAHSLHVVSYSVPVRATMTRDELEPHLHSLPEHPDWIPYRTSYYREDWGFCLRHTERMALGPGPFEVVIDAELAPGHLTYAEFVIRGTTDEEALIYTHVCHPSLANDNLSGIAVATALAQAMRDRKPRLTWRFVFAPGTIGSLTWLARNENTWPSIRAGLVIGLLGDGGPLLYKRSRRGSTVIDRVAEYVLGAETGTIIDFEPYGYDERQFCSPGIDLPVGRLTRSPNGGFPEYHTSADNLSFVSVGQLAGSIRTLAHMISVVDGNRCVLNLSSKGEPQLGKRGLYKSMGGTGPEKFENALLWVLSQSDGKNDLVGIAQRSGIDFEVLDQAALALEQSGLVRTVLSTETDMDVR